MHWNTADVARVYSELSRSWDVKRTGFRVISGCSNRLRRVLPEHVNDRSRLLDFGCGTGKVYSDLARQNVVHEEFVMIDASSEMCEVARAKVGREKSVTVLNGDEYSDELRLLGPYDVITLSQVLHHLPNPKETLLRLRCLAAPDATLVLLVPGPSYQSKVFPFDPKVSRDPVGRFAVVALEDMLEDAGWRVDSIYDDRFIAAYENNERFESFLRQIGLLSKLSNYKGIAAGANVDLPYQNETSAELRVECQHITITCTARRGEN